MKKVITIAREFGAGGTSVGREVAKRLELEFYDKDLILRTARASANLTPEEVRRWDEKVPHDFGFTQSLFDFYNRPLGDRIWDAQVAAIREMANNESCVILGRNANFILREYDHTLRVFLHADYEWRVRHMMELMPEKTEDQVRADIKAVDKARQKFSTHYTGRPYGMASNFDLTVNVGLLGFDGAVQQILLAAEKI